MTGRFAPAHAAHSIDHVNATIAFSERLTGSEWLQVLMCAQDCASDLGFDVYADVIGGLTQAVQAPIGTREPSSFSLIVNAMGASFSQLADDGSPLQTLTVSRVGIGFESRSYVRWSGFSEILYYAIHKLLPTCPKNIAITQARLEYRDRYVQTTSADDRDPGWKQVLRHESDISQNNLDRLESWHQHSGWFVEDDLRNRRLVNLHVDATVETNAEKETKRSIFIYSLIAGVGATSAPEAASTIIAEFEILHGSSKAVLGSILTEDMQKSISLKNNEQEK